MFSLSYDRYLVLKQFMQMVEFYYAIWT